MSKPLSQSFVIKSRSMKRAPVIPNSQIILPPPPEPNLQIVAPLHHLLQLRQQLVALIRPQLVNPLGKRPYRKNALPPRHRIRPHDGMHGLECGAYILRTAARTFVDAHLVRTGGRSAGESVAGKSRRQSLQKLPVRGAEPIVHFVPACP